MGDAHFLTSYKRHMPICLQGDPAEHLFILKRGKVGVYVMPDPTSRNITTILQQGKQVNLIEGQGTVFGENGLFQKERNASLIALQDGTCVEHVSAKKQTLRQAMLENPKLSFTLGRSLAQRLRDMDSHLREYAEIATSIEAVRAQLATEYMHLTAQLERLAQALPEAATIMEAVREGVFYSYCQGITDERNTTAFFFQQSSVKNRSGFLRLEPGQLLIQEGEIGRSLFYIQEGRLEVLIGKRMVCQLGANEIVGEMAVLVQELPKRSATVRAVEPSILKGIPLIEFKKAVEQEPQIMIAILCSLIRRLDRTNHLVCLRSNDSTKAFDMIADGPHSCEQEFLKLAELMKRFAPLEELMQRATRLANQAQLYRRDLLMKYEGFLMS